MRKHKVIKMAMLQFKL